MFALVLSLSLCCLGGNAASVDGVCLSCNIRSSVTNELKVEFLPFNRNIFNGLEYINIIVAEMKVVDKEVLFQNMVYELGQVIVKHGLDQYIGVANLHKHFELEFDERVIFVARFEQNKMVYHSKPTNDTDCNHVPFMFKAIQSTANDQKVQWAPLQYFCDKAQEYDDNTLLELYTRMFSGEFDAFLNDIAFVLDQNNGYDAAGLYYRFDMHSSVSHHINKGEFLIEKTYDDRSQKFQIVDKIDGNSIATLYNFNDEDCNQLSGIMGDTDMCMTQSPRVCIHFCETDLDRNHVIVHTGMGITR